MSGTTETGDASTELGDWALVEIRSGAVVMAAAIDATKWGFPREITRDELERGTWFRMGWPVVFWFEAPHPADPTAAILHLAVDPDVRGRWPVRRWAMAVEVIAELMGFTHLLAAIPVGSAARDYALRIGWRESDGPRLVRWLGGAHGRQERRIPEPDLHERGMEGR